MAQTMNKEARRLRVRTYEGVQWFDHGWGLWIASVPGTNLAVKRFKDEHGWWRAYLAVPIVGKEPFFWHAYNGRSLPWMSVRGNVKSISRDVQVLRAFVDGRSPHGVA